ncbi:MAG: hypothetical protein ABSH51_32295 [Solirubrobacteraceae bacterium]
MTLSLITNIIAATIAFVAIVGPLTWAIMTSRDAQAGSPHFA